MGPLVEEKFFSAQPATTYFPRGRRTAGALRALEMGTVPIEAKTFGARLAGFAVSAGTLRVHPHE
jgi:hypothetical protein